MFDRRLNSWRGLLPMSFIGVLLSLGPPLFGQAIHRGIFELEGDAQDSDPAKLPDDWGALFNGSGNASAFTGITPDPGSTTVFTGGSSKDIHDVNIWLWKDDSGGLPDKDNITNASAAAYADPVTGDELIYFQIDRFANSGDAMLGFWFFQNSISLNNNGTFNGTHVVNDVLVLANFLQGGSVPSIQVLKWVGTGGDQQGGTLQLVFDDTAAPCVTGSEAACGITNGGPTASPWPYTPKAGNVNEFPPQSFFEGVVNITQLLGLSPCFTTFLAESRASQSITATLKDFVLAGLPICEIAVQKVCEVVRLTRPSDATDRLFVVAFNGSVTNTGAGVFAAGETLTIIDDAGTPGDASDDVTIQSLLAAPLEPGESVPFAGEFFSNDNPPVNTVRASLTFGAGTALAEPFTVTCKLLDLNPDLFLEKNCFTQLRSLTADGLTVVVVQVNFAGKVCNTGDLPLSVAVSDPIAGLSFSVELDAGVRCSTDVDCGGVGACVGAGDAQLGVCEAVPGSFFGGSVPVCETFGGSFLPASANGGVTDPGVAAFSNTVTATGTNPAVTSSVSETVTATCPLCPPPQP